MRQDFPVIKNIRKARNLRQIRGWLDWSLTYTAERLGVSRSQVCAWQQFARQINQMALDRLASAIAEKLTAQQGRLVGVTMRVNSPWRIRAHTQCRDCRHWFQMRRDTSRRCWRCVKRRREGQTRKG